MPYVTAWEYKPPGLFALCAAGLLVFRDAFFSASLLATFAVIATALASATVLVAAGGEETRRAARVAAVTIVLLSTENAGVAGDAELFVNAFVALAFAATFLRPRRRATFLAALAAAAALQMKLTAFPLIVALGLQLALAVGGSVALSLSTFSAVVILPFALEAAWYARAGVLGSFLDANLFATLRRAAGARASAATNPSQWVQELRILAPSLQLAVVACFRPSRGAAIAALWFVAALVAVIGAHEYYARHFLLFVPPVAMLGAIGTLRLAANVRDRARAGFVAAVVLLTFFLHDYYEITQGARILVHRYALGDAAYREGDYTVILAKLRTMTKGDTSFYAVQISPEIYADLGVPPPTRYIFSANLFERPMWPMLGFSGRDEFARVLRTKPHVIACGPLGDRLDSGGVALLHDTLAREYRYEGAIRNVRIYRLRAIR